MQIYDSSDYLGYIQLPVPFIRLLLVKPKETEDVIRYCIYMKALDYDADNMNVYRQVLYVFYHTHDLDTSGTNIILRPGYCFPTEISCKIIELWKRCTLELDFDRYGFGADGEFLDNSDSDISSPLQTLEQYASFNDSFSCACKQWYRIRQVCVISGVQMEDVNNYKDSYERFSQYNIPPTPYASIKVAMLQRHRGLSQEYERVQFACYAAIKSIIGIKDYGQASKELILARMTGQKKQGVLEVELLGRKDRTEANNIYNKYSTRRQFEKLLNDLRTYNYIMGCYGKKKAGYYISTKLCDDELKSIER